MSDADTPRTITKRELSQIHQMLGVSDDALWLWGRLREFEERGLLARDPKEVLSHMTQPMQADVQRLAGSAGDWLKSSARPPSGNGEPRGTSYRIGNTDSVAKPVASVQKEGASHG